MACFIIVTAVGPAINAEATPNPLENPTEPTIVNSFNTRTGIVVPAAGDYAASIIENDSAVTGDNVNDALDWLNTNKQAADATLTAIAALTFSANKIMLATGDDTFSVGALTNAYVDDSAAIARSKIAVGTADHVVINSGTGAFSSEAQLAIARGGTGAASTSEAYVFAGPASGAGAPAFRALVAADIPSLGAIYQPIDAGLTSISGLTTAADRMIYTTAHDTYAVSTLTAAGRALIDDADAAAQLTTLGIPLLATTGITGILTLSKTGTTARTATFPDRALTVAGTGAATTDTALSVFDASGNLTASAFTASATTITGPDVSVIAAATSLKLSTAFLGVGASASQQAAELLMVDGTSYFDGAMTVVGDVTLDDIVVQTATLEVKSSVTNSNTTLAVHGNGTGYGRLFYYDEAETTYVESFASGGKGWIRTNGTSVLTLQSGGGSGVSIGTAALIGAERLRVSGGTAATAGATDVCIGAGSISVGANITTIGTVGVGVASPAAQLEVLKTTEQFRASYSAAVYASHTVNSSGYYTIAPTGALVNITGSLSASVNIGTGVTAWGTDATKTIGLGTGTAPSSSPADMVQLYSADRAADEAMLSVLDEKGNVRRIGSYDKFPSVAAPTPEDGEIWNDSTQKTFKSFTSGMTGCLQRTLFSACADVTHSGVVTDQSLKSGTAIGSATLPANFFVAGKSIRLRLGGHYTTDVSPGTVTLQVKFGATVLRTTGAVAPAASKTDAVWQLDLEIICQSAGGSGTLQTLGVTKFDDDQGSFTAVAAASWTTVDPVTVDTEAESAVDVLITATDAGTEVVCTGFTIEELS